MNATIIKLFRNIEEVKKKTALKVTALLLREAKQELRDNQKIASRDLFNSLTVENYRTEEGFGIVLTSKDDGIDAIIDGRAKNSTMVSTDEILRWVRSKNIRPIITRRAKKVAIDRRTKNYARAEKSMVFAMSVSIMKKGIKKYPFYSLVLKRALPKINALIEQDLGTKTIIAKRGLKL